MDGAREGLGGAEEDLSLFSGKLETPWCGLSRYGILFAKDNPFQERKEGNYGSKSLLIDRRASSAPSSYISNKE